jgi:hypothetical protein
MQTNKRAQNDTHTQVHMNVNVSTLVFHFRSFSFLLLQTLAVAPGTSSPLLSSSLT